MTMFKTTLKVKKRKRLKLKNQFDSLSDNPADWLLKPMTMFKTTLKVKKLKRFKLKNQLDSLSDNRSDNLWGNQVDWQRQKNTSKVKWKSLKLKRRNRPRNSLSDNQPEWLQNLKKMMKPSPLLKGLKSLQRSPKRPKMMTRMKKMNRFQDDPCVNPEGWRPKKK